MVQLQAMGLSASAVARRARGGWQRAGIRLHRPLVRFTHSQITRGPATVAKRLRQLLAG